MSIIYRIHAWRLGYDEETQSFTIENTDNGNYATYSSGQYRFPQGKFRVPISVDRQLQAKLNSLSLDRLSSRTYGVEIECYHLSDRDIKEKVVRELANVGIACKNMGYTHEVVRTWKIVTDSSIRGGYGLEVVSPILSGEEGIEQITKVTRVLSSLGCRVNRSTGLHVHHGANDLSSEDIKKIFKFYKDNEWLIDKLVANSRRANNNTYCASLIRYNDIPSTRYVKLNYQAYLKYGTLEVRHHQGTLNADKISHWIRLTQRIIERGAMGQKFYSLSDLIHFLGLDNMANWYLERAEELSA